MPVSTGPKKPYVHLALGPSVHQTLALCLGFFDLGLVPWSDLGLRALVSLSSGLHAQVSMICCGVLDGRG